MSSEYLNESLTTSVVRVSRQQKINRLAAGFAIRLAKERDDPLYKKYIRFRRLFWAAKKVLVKRYGARGLLAARKAIMRKK